MKLFDENRPRINNQPAYGSPPVAVLPHLQMMPKSHGLTLVSAMLFVGDSSFTWFTNYADTSMIPNLLSRYHANPEEFLESFFNYKIPDKQKIERKAENVISFKNKSSKQTLSILDL